LSIEEDLVKKKYTYFLENPNSTEYQFYLRLLTDKNSGLAPVEIYSENEKKEVEPIIYGYDNFKEAGIFVEIEQNETKAVVFKWEDHVDNLKEKDGYLQTIVKQSGVDKFRLDMILSDPGGIIIPIKGASSLTDGSGFSYNTEIANDLAMPIYWKN